MKLVKKQLSSVARVKTNEYRGGELARTSETLLRILFFTLIISVMNATIFNVVLPSISQEFNLSASQVSWITTGYGIMYAVGSVTYGKLADQFRLKDLLTFGLIFMSFGSLIGILATEYWMIVAGRMLQAGGAAVIPATAMIIPIRYFALENRGRALGTVASGLALGAALSPIVSSFISGLLGWRILFCFSFFALLTLPFFRKHLHDQPKKGKSFDFLGGLLLACTVVFILLAITNNSLLALGLGILFLLLFFLRIQTAKEPFIQLSLFENRHYTFSVAIALLAISFGTAVYFITPQLLANVNEVPTSFIGFILFPGAIAAALLGRKGGKLADQNGNLFLFKAASIPLLIAFSALSILAGMSPAWIWIFLILANIGQTFMQVVMQNTVSRTLSDEQVGIGMGFFTMMNFIAGSAATTLMGKVLDLTASVHFNPLQVFDHATVYSNAFFILFVILVLVVVLYTAFIKFSTEPEAKQELAFKK
ncbi:DHA2 family metal-tetracycline-proton antiporter-like MFS transporter [Bacillus oleivorans]|uniref:DHA2 family metal-tetracycline-proton antiporter-like MFS transporter n=1 Tax=Bacillus oleivorans TaxID=1448271 RepID=A0A285CIE6_9BACI|nr:MFS transporter [Bacillus oleivorans]SNX66763.1 DHA2 family metal-tetracycline-proton antiporter-like MFS transporter [Bacillus oleivorans]